MAEPSDLRPLVERPAIMFMDLDEATWGAMSKVEQVDYARCALIEALGTWKTTVNPAAMISARIRTAMYLLNEATDGAVHSAAALLPRSNEIFQARERRAAS